MSWKGGGGEGGKENLDYTRRKDLKARRVQGRVVRKPVNVNPGLNFN